MGSWLRTSAGGGTVARMTTYQEELARVRAQIDQARASLDVCDGLLVKLVEANTCDTVPDQVPSLL